MSRELLLLFHFGRSGSTVLTQSLGQHPDIVSFGEIATMALRDPSAEIAAPGALAGLLEAAALEKPKAAKATLRCFELKYINLLTAGFRPSLAATLDALAAGEAFPDARLHVAILTRKNLLKRVVSSLKAANSGVYHLHGGLGAEDARKARDAFDFPIERASDYDTGHVNLPLPELLAKATATEQSVKSAIRARFPNVLELNYERDVEGDLPGGVGRILDFVGRPRFPAEAGLRKTSQGLDRDLSNYQAVRSALVGTPFAWMAAR